MWNKCRVCSRFSFFSEIFQTIFRNLSVFTGNCCFTSAGAAPQVFFWGKKQMLPMFSWQGKDVEKVEVFLHFFFASIFQKVFGKNRSFQMYRVSFFQICFIFPMFFRTSFLRRVFESEINPKKQKLYEYFQDLTLWLRRVFEYPRHRDDDSNWHRVNRPMDPAFSDLPLRQPTRVEIIPKNTCHEHVQQNRMITEYPRIN